MYDVVALTEDFPQQNLARGQVGTVVEQLADDVYEIEFCDNDGRTYAMLTARRDQLIVLRYEPLAVGMQAPLHRPPRIPRLGSLLSEVI